MGSSIEPLSSATGSATPAHPAVKVGINWLVVEDPRDIELTVDVCMQPLLRLTRIAQAATHKRTLTGVGIVGFYYLPEKTKIKVNVTYGESRHEFDVQTGARDPSLPCATSFIDPKTIMTPSIMFDGPEDILWSSGRLTYEFFKRILYFAMFILPHNCMCAIPNPTKRFCLELRGWKKGKKVRRYASQFRLGLSRNIRKSFAAVRRYHNTKHEGTWVEDELVNCFERLAGDEDNRGVKGRAISGAHIDEVAGIFVGAKWLYPLVLGIQKSVHGFLRWVQPFVLEPA
eukprot:GEMP01071394.1.p1 GENE.GEMP01071394.1~~GEMP01071394.1.p1  ORF type:complete len:286 (+),score=39.54 GEMP01071394.1:97-954(+)